MTPNSPPGSTLAGRSSSSECNSPEGGARRMLIAPFVFHEIAIVPRSIVATIANKSGLTLYDFV
jgi:hypothetical protein